MHGRWKSSGEGIAGQSAEDGGWACAPSLMPEIRRAHMQVSIMQGDEFRLVPLLPQQNVLYG